MIEKYHFWEKKQNNNRDTLAKRYMKNSFCRSKILGY